MPFNMLPANIQIMTEYGTWKQEHSSAIQQPSVLHTAWLKQELATDIHFQLQVCLPWSFTTKMLLVHMHCLLRVGGSIGPVSSSFCDVPSNVHVPPLETKLCPFYMLQTQGNSNRGQPSSNPPFSAQLGNYRQQKREIQPSNIEHCGGHVMAVFMVFSERKVACWLGGREPQCK